MNGMTTIKTPRTMINRMQQRLVSSPGAANSPSEIAIRSIHEKRSTPRW